MELEQNPTRYTTISITKTLAARIENVYEKAGANNRADFVRVAIRNLLRMYGEDIG